MTLLKPPRGHSILPRRLLALVGAALLCIVLLPAAAAQADTGSTLTVVGTSDVSDSGLIPNLIQPEFQAAYPQFTFKYIGTATGTAITDAETGSVGASVLIVHAASLENQFVAGGYSYEQYGRALFTNDFVLAGPTGDPAGVTANAGNNIVQAFEDVATAGINGAVTFVSRGGTPGTTVEEHAIWALVAGNNPPAGLLLCAVSVANGGGDTPIDSGNGVTANGQGCPNGGALPTGSQLPAWYVATGLTQGPNVVAANACTGYASPSGNSCYVLTDRGTYDYLSSGTDPAGTIPGLKVVTRGPQSASAPGGTNLLVNYFHGYIINPNKVVSGGTTNEPVNLPAAQAFLDFITSPTVQAQLKTYLPNADPAGPPFVADASPILTASGIPASVTAGTPVTVTGTLTNAESGYPALTGQTVTLDEIVGGVGVPVAHATTGGGGAYRMTFKAATSGSYEATTSQIAQIENPSLSPPFGDLLSPASTAPVRMTLHPRKVSFKRIRVKEGKVTVAGTLNLAPAGSGARVWLLAAQAPTNKHAKKPALRRVASSTVRGKSFTIRVKLGRQVTWRLELKFTEKGQPTVFSKVRTLTVH